MKTIKQLKKMKAEIIADSMHLEDKYKRESRNRVEFLNQCILYLELEPREPFLYNQLNDLKKKLRNIMDSKPYFEDKTHEYSWMRKHNIQLIKNQIENLDFILNAEDDLIAAHRLFMMKIDPYYRFDIEKLMRLK